MKKYIVCMLYNIDAAPQCVAHFDDYQEAVIFCSLSHKTDTEHHYAVYSMTATTKPAF